MRFILAIFVFFSPLLQATIMTPQSTQAQARGCNPNFTSCPIQFQQRTPFGFHQQRLPGSHMWQVGLGQSQFNLNFDAGLMSGAQPNLQQYQFFNDHRFQIYGMNSLGGQNPYSHYFQRKNQQFNYLGHFPPLKYDGNTRSFFTQERRNCRVRRCCRRKNYRIKDEGLTETGKDSLLPDIPEPSNRDIVQLPTPGVPLITDKITPLKNPSPFLPQTETLFNSLAPISPS